MTRARMNVFVEPEHAKRLDELSAHKGVSRSAVVASALASFLAPDGGDARALAVGKRLDRLSRQFDRLERDQNILIETVALYVRYYMTVSLPVPAGQQDAARAQGRARYQHFIAQLGQHLQRGRSLVQDLRNDIAPEAAADTPPDQAGMDGGLAGDPANPLHTAPPHRAESKEVRDAAA